MLQEFSAKLFDSVWHQMYATGNEKASLSCLRQAISGLLLHMYIPAVAMVWRLALAVLIGYSTLCTGGC
jgi:hypothetical protein